MHNDGSLRKLLRENAVVAPSIKLTLSHHETTEGTAYQQITIALVSRDRIITPTELSGLLLPAGIDPRKGVLISAIASVAVCLFSA